MKKTFALSSALAVMLAVLTALTLSLSACFVETDYCDHVWDDGTVIEQPTYTSEGVKKYVCTKCGEEKTESIPVLCEHSWDDGTVITKASYTADGQIEYVCAKCGEKKTETIPKLALPEPTPDATVTAVAESNVKQLFADAFAANETATAVKVDLPAGEFSMKNEKTSATFSFSGKSVIINGSGADTKYGSTYTEGKDGEYGADYTFDGAQSVVFKNLTINLGNSNFNGFIRPQSLVFENCVINGMGSYWGTGSVLFVNCTFNNDNGYNMWTYSGSEFVFEGCTFNSAKGKFLNVYKTAKADATITMTNCKFVGTEVSKAALNIKKNAGTIWTVSLNNCTLEGVDLLYKVNTPDYGAADTNDYSETKVYVDSKLVWQGDAAITE